MIALRKRNLILLCLLFPGISGMAQEKSDLGIIISVPNNPEFAFEYRKPLNEKYRLKLGLTAGDSQFNSNFPNGEIISVTDSIVTERVYYRNSYQFGLRAGAERRFGMSMFSMGADINVDYRRTDKSYFNHSTYLLEDGTWGEGAFTTQFPPGKDPAASRIIQHFIVPALRVSINMDIPVGKRFLINLAVANTLGLPVYMGASQVNDPLDEFLGSPPATFDFETQIYAGLRYMIGFGKE